MCPSKCSVVLSKQTNECGPGIPWTPPRLWLTVTGHDFQIFYVLKMEGKSLLRSLVPAVYLFCSCLF